MGQDDDDGNTMTWHLSKRWVVYPVLTYLIMWVVTMVHGPVRLQAQLVDVERERSRMLTTVIAQQEQTARTQALAAAIKSGPRVNVRLVSCPIPFLFHAQRTQSLGGLYRQYSVNWYYYTPWRIYERADSIQYREAQPTDAAAARLGQ